MTTKTFTRQHLYDRVWQEPVDRVARELGISNVGLGKLCRRHDIPAPPRGSWARKAAGYAVKQPPLPATTDPSTERIVIHGARTAVAEPDVHPLIAFEQDPANCVRILDEVELTHPLVVKTARLLRRSKRDATGRIAIVPGVLRLYASRASHERGLRVWQQLLKECASRDFLVEIGEDGTRVSVLGESLAIAISEATKRVAHQVTFTEQKEIDRGRGWGIPKWDDVPSGELTLAITNVSQARQRWTDGRVKIEQQLNKFFIGLVRAALEVKRQRDEAERRARAHALAEQRRREAERRLAEEKGRQDRLGRLVNAWEQAQRVHGLLAAYRAAVGPAEPDSELGRWLAWLDSHAASMDPVGRLNTGRILRLYHATYNADDILEHGFQDAQSVSWAQDEPSGVRLTGRRSGYGTLVEVHLPENVVLPYEWVEPGSAERTFHVPADLVNRHAIKAAAG